uniref:Uncharacterized protein n=1 Tax=Pseudomonas graminis TaxID=158627 RepID=A0A7C1X2T8_9PSED
MGRGVSVDGWVRQAQRESVGVSLLTKTAFHPLEFWQMLRPLRGQARSYRCCVSREICGAPF